MEKRPISEEGIVHTNIRFSYLQVLLAFTAIKHCFTNEKLVKRIDYIVDVCGECNSPESIDLYLSLEGNLSKKLEEINWEKHTNAGELTVCSADKVNIYWEKELDKDKEGLDTDWYLAKSGYPLCGMHFNDVFTGKKSFDECPCPIEYRERICKPLKKIVDAVHAIDGKSMARYVQKNADLTCN